MANTKREAIHFRSHGCAVPADYVDCSIDSSLEVLESSTIGYHRCMLQAVGWLGCRSEEWLDPQEIIRSSRIPIIPKNTQVDAMDTKGAEQAYTMLWMTEPDRCSGCLPS